MQSRLLSFEPPERPQPAPGVGVHIDQGPHSVQPPSTAASVGSMAEVYVHYYHWNFEILKKLAVQTSLKMEV